jgi:hypothetical protein
MALISVSISAPVGTRNGKTVMANTPKDLAIVADLFDRIPIENGGSAELFGVWSKNRDDLIAEVTAQIITFQKTNGLASLDGVIDPGGGTLKLMNKLAADQLITRMPGEPQWEDWGYQALPQLSHNRAPEIDWELNFGGAAPRAMSTRAYECDKALGTPHIGIGFPAGVTHPSAYLLYFHHSIGQEAKDYAGAATRFKKGIGDYLIGRMRGLDQISFSGKNVCLMVPEPTFGGQGVFSFNEKLVTETLKEIDADLTSGQARDLPPLLLASYSDGLGLLRDFMNYCPNLRQTVRGVYDFDGLYVTSFSDVTLSDFSKAGAKVFRYVGEASPWIQPKETKPAYLNRCLGRSPKIVPLPHDRWVNHPHFPEYKTNVKWWLHIFIPSCMLRHGLACTDGI